MVIEDPWLATLFIRAPLKEDGEKAEAEATVAAKITQDVVFILVLFLLSNLF